MTGLKDLSASIRDRRTRKYKRSKSTCKRSHRYDGRQRPPGLGRRERRKKRRGRLWLHKRGRRGKKTEGGRYWTPGEGRHDVQRPRKKGRPGAAKGCAPRKKPEGCQGRQGCFCHRRRSARLSLRRKGPGPDRRRTGTRGRRARASRSGVRSPSAVRRRRGSASSTRLRRRRSGGVGRGRTWTRRTHRRGSETMTLPRPSAPRSRPRPA